MKKANGFSESIAADRRWTFKDADRIHQSRGRELLKLRLAGEPLTMAVQKLSKRFGVNISPQQLSMVRSGKRYPSAELILGLQELYGIPSEAWLYLDEVPTEALPRDVPRNSLFQLLALFAAQVRAREGG
jgi:transcriptional regulator with XRE-family HTH domain